MPSNCQHSSCCAPRTEPDPPSEKACPACGVSSQRQVKAVTLQALLSGPVQGLVSKAVYQVCLNQACSAVYFDPSDGAVFTKEQVSVRIGFKEPDDPRPLCYCFDHSWESLRKEWLETGQSTATASIQASIRVRGCRCEETNPMGVCCLADVATALEEIQR